MTCNHAWPSVGCVALNCNHASSNDSIQATNTYLSLLFQASAAQLVIMASVPLSEVLNLTNTIVIYLQARLVSNHTHSS